MLSAQKAENVRRVGVYVGPAILASVVANAAYGLLFGTTTINIGGLPFFMNVVFAVMGGVIAWGMTDRLGRIGWMVFALHHGIQALAAFWRFRIGGGWSLGLITLFALLATGSGARNASRRTLFVAGSVFVVASIAVFCARYYADELLGNHSVIR
jgi:hypothetical protein